MKRFCFVLLMAFALSSCSIQKYTVSHIDNNYQLKRASSTIDKVGIEINGESYEDKYVTISLQDVTPVGIYLTLANNSDSTIRILWDEAAFVDVEGYSHRINHDNNSVSDMVFESSTRHYNSENGPTSSRTEGSAKVIDKERVQVPYVIPANARINTVVVPSDNATIVLYDNLGELEYSDEERALQHLTHYRESSENTAIKLLLPIEVDTKKVEYTITFQDEFKLISIEKEKFPLSPLVFPIIVIFLLPIL